MRQKQGRARAIAIITAVSALAFVSGNGSAAQPLVVTSSSFANGASIPRLYTCEGKNVSPPLAWTEAPSGTKSFALIVVDPDSPDPKAPKRTWVQWIVYDLPASTRSLDEAIQAFPSGAAQGRNDRHLVRYDGPCPAIGQHRYFFKLFALDVVLPASLGAPTKDELELAMKGHILERAELMGLYAMRAEIHSTRR
jgi:Raf kinase inhibitor-like YbhB/YbcL family protein